MKEKFSKPEISILMSIVIGNNNQDQNKPNAVDDNGDIFISFVPGGGGDDWD